MRTSAAEAIWEGGVADGEGRFKADSGAFEGLYSFRTRFKEDPGTNPEELLAATHAACLSMAIAHGLGERGAPPDMIEARAYCTIDRGETGFAVTQMRLVVRGRVRGVDAATFLEIAEEAKVNCPISRALAGNVELELDAQLEG